MVMFHCLKSRKYYSKSKIRFLELIAERFEKDIELLDLQIQSYTFQYPQKFLESLPSRKQEEIVLPIDLQIEDDYFFEYKT